MMAMDTMIRAANADTKYLLPKVVCWVGPLDFSAVFFRLQGKKSYRRQKLRSSNISITSGTG